MGSAGGDLPKRVLVAVVGVPLAVGLVYLGGFWLTGFVALIATLAAREFFDIHRARGIAVFPVAGILLAVGFVLIAAASVDVGWAIVLTLLLATPAALRTSPQSDPALAVAVTVFGAVYTGGLLGFALPVRAFGGTVTGWEGTGVLLLPVVSTWLGDTGAYFVGRAIGRNPLAPTTSPAKTWEGAIAGLVVTVGTALVYVRVTEPVVGWTLSSAAIVGFGALVAIAGQAGDLVESRFKRGWGVKDSSNILPGHGGMLDRIDSLLFVFPVSYAYLKVLGV